MLSAERSCRTEEETMALGEEVGRALRPGQVVALSGPLGAGKTVFMKGVARAFGLDPAAITSPTFTFVHRHETERGGPLVHVDLFRAETPRELASIGLDEILAAGTRVVVEWAERAGAHLPADSIHVRIDYAAAGRRIRIENLRDSATAHASTRLSTSGKAAAHPEPRRRVTLSSSKGGGGII